MRKALCIVLAAVLLTGVCACAPKQATSIYKADNEIFTYQKINPDKTQLIVSRTGNIPVEQLCEAFEASNADIQVIYLDITGGNSAYKPLTDWIVAGDSPDVVITAAGFFDDELTKSLFTDMSDYPIIKEYQAEALQRTSVDGHIYWLPGPSNISAMMYNKTLFDEYGWTVPATFDEFVSLCDQIREETNGEIEPWNPNAKYELELLTALQAFSYEELLAGVDNRSWYNDLLAGQEAFAGHMEPYFDMVQTLIDHRLLCEEHFTYSATTRGEEFADGKIAMINMNIYEADNDKYDFSIMPFPTTQGTLGYICDTYSYYAGLPIKEHTEKQAEAVERFVEFFSSPAGQAAYIGNTLKISNVKGVTLDTAGDIAALLPVVDAGHMFELLDYRSADGSIGGLAFTKYISEMVAGTMTGAQCVSALDADLSKPVIAEEKEPERVLATAPEDMTILETSFFIADAYRSSAGADIGLIANNEVYRGNMMRVYAGDMTEGRLGVFKPRSFANGSTLVKLSMTGQQLLDALNHPVGHDALADCIYAFSGLKCEAAPWNELGSRYLSVKLADGSELQRDKLYTVACWDGTVAQAYITETLEVYEGTWEEILTAYLSEVGTLAAADDGRIKLSWN